MIFDRRVERGRFWRKIPDALLGTYVTRRLVTRERVGMTPGPERSRTLASSIRRDRREISPSLGGLHHGRTAAASRVRAAADAARPAAKDA